MRGSRVFQRAVNGPISGQCTKRYKPQNTGVVVGDTTTREGMTLLPCKMLQPPPRCVFHVTGVVDAGGASGTSAAQVVPMPSAHISPHHRRPWPCLNIYLHDTCNSVCGTRINSAGVLLKVSVNDVKKSVGSETREAVNPPTATCARPLCHTQYCARRDIHTSSNHFPDTLFI